jgi:SAM-dependent methyltransferase
MTARRPASTPAVPAYFDGVLEAHAHGAWGRWVHLGLWGTPPSAQELARPGAYDMAMAHLDDRLRALADLRDNQCVLDVGCGLGGTLQAVDARHVGMQLVGINIDPRQLAACRRFQARPGNRLLWVQADATALP